MAVHVQFDQSRHTLQASDGETERPMLETALARARNARSFRINRAA